MNKQPKIITLSDYNPMNSTESNNNIVWARFLGKEEFAVIDDEVLKAIVKANGIEGEKEILRMADRGQISLDDAKFILADRYEIVAKTVPCEWN